MGQNNDNYRDNTASEATSSAGKAPERKKVRNPWASSGPFYVMAAIWLIWSLVFPLNSAGSVFLCALTSVAGFGISKMFWPREILELETNDQKKVSEEKKKNQEKTSEDTGEKKKDKYRDSVKKRPRTGDAAIDKMLDEEELAIAEMLRLDDAIEDTKVSAQIVHLEEVTSKIVSYVVEHPEKRTTVRRFFNYYLPTTLKLLNAYDRMDEAGISGMNIDGTKGKVEEMMDTSLAAFDKQLDALYADEALDISSDIKVMEGLLAQEGLKDDDISTPGLKL